MSLLVCKECGGQVSSSADRCPSCGAKVKNNSLLFFVLAIILFFIIVGALTNTSKVGSANEAIKESAAQVVTDQNLDVQILAERQIKDTAKDPASVDFRGVSSKYTEKYGDVACGEFNAKNGFGGYIGFTRFISNGKTLFIEGRNDSKIPFKKMWQEAC